MRRGSDGRPAGGGILSSLVLVGAGMVIGVLPFLAKPLIVLGAAGGLLVFLLVLRDPRIGLFLIILSIPLETAGHVGNLIGNLPLTIPKLMTMVTLAAWLVNYAMHKVVFRSMGWMYILVVFWVVCCLSIIGASEVRSGFEALFRFATTIIFFFLVVQLIDSKKMLTCCLLLFTIATTAAASQSLVQRFMPGSTQQFRHGWEESEARRGGVEVDIVEQKMVGLVNRSSGLSLHSIILALNIALVIAPLTVFFGETKSREVPKRIGWLILLGIALASVVVTYSRTGLLLMFFATGLMLLHRLIRITPLKIVLVLLILAVGVVALPEKYKKRVLDLKSYTMKSNSVSTRVEAQAAVWGQFLDHPLLGVGYGNRYGIFEYFTQYPDKKHAVTPHNAYLQVLAQVGSVGLLVVCLFFLNVHLRIWRAIGWFRQEGEDTFANIGIALNISMLTVLFSGMALDLFDKGLPQMWLIIGMSAAFVRIATDERAAVA